MTWTEPRCELLKKLWSEGRTAGQIAVELGGVSRNAIIGKVHRMGLAGRERKSSAPRGPKPERKAPMRPRKVAATPQADGPPTEPAEPVRPIEHPVIPVGQRRTIFELTNETCRWPIGDPGTKDFFYCGGPNTPGSVYCGFHHAIGYQPLRAIRPVFVPQRRH